MLSGPAALLTFTLWRVHLTFAVNTDNDVFTEGGVDLTTESITYVFLWCHVNNITPFNFMNQPFLIHDAALSTQATGINRNRVSEKSSAPIENNAIKLILSVTLAHIVFS